MMQFNDIYQEVERIALLPLDRLFMIYQLSNHVIDLDGDVVEVGVYKGGSAKFLSRIFGSKKQMYLFDTFKGMPNADPRKDKYKNGAFGDTTLKKVKNYLSDCSNIHIYKGIFPRSATAIKNKKFCFVHIDVDVYKSIYDCCTFFYNRLVKNAIMIYDDYEEAACPGVKEAVDEFFLDKKEYVIVLSTNQAFIIKK